VPEGVSYLHDRVGGNSTLLRCVGDRRKHVSTCACEGEIRSGWRYVIVTRCRVGRVGVVKLWGEVGERVLALGGYWIEGGVMSWAFEEDGWSSKIG
jgi:hypothetical protein